MRFRPYPGWKTVGTAALLNGVALLAMRRRAHLQRRSSRDGRSTEWKAAADSPDTVISIREEERRRLARDLHDVLGRRISALRLYLERMQCADGCANRSSRVEELLALVDQLDDEMDLLAWQLRPPVLDEVGVTAALHAFVRAWSRTNGVPVEFDAKRVEVRLPPQVETCLYRIAQEALSNVARHARATQVIVRLEQEAYDVCLVVQDDGCGFEPRILNKADPGDRRLGVIGMRERALLVGGYVALESAPGSGTTVVVRLRTEVAAAVAKRNRPANV